MVQPARSCNQVEQPVLGPLPPGSPYLNRCNQKEFLKILKANAGVGEDLGGEGQRANAARQNQTAREPQIEPTEDPRLTLAPGAEPGMGRGPYDAIEWLFVVNPGGVEPAPAPDPGQRSVGPPDIEASELVERWVRRVALGGDARRGVAKLDIGHGRYAGAELLVVAEAGRIAVELNLPHAEAASGLVDRVRSRLERRGYEADVVVLTAR